MHSFSSGKQDLSLIVVGKQLFPLFVIGEALIIIGFQLFVFKKASIICHLRSIPSLMDGLKTSQRKAMCVALSSLKADTKVTVFSNLVMSKMNYHHGDASMAETIVKLAQTHLGTHRGN